jgi:ABC-2 type transport system permease protein
LLQNEVIKMMRKRRFYVVLLILAALIPMFTYAQMKVAESNRKQFGTEDWRAELRQKVTDYTRSIGSNRVPEEWKQWRRVEVKRMQYYLDKDVNPSSPNAVTFTKEFVKNAITLFIPLMVMVIASDLISSEHSTGTIKVLLTRPVERWKILLSKLLALIMFISLTVICTGLLCYLIAGVIFGYGGWTMPEFIGFAITGTEVDFTFVRTVPQWLFLIMEFGLVWFAALMIGIMSLMVSVLVRSTAAGMGIMLALIIAGTILTNMVSSWETAKYLFMVNLRLTDYLTGTMPPIKGMDLAFSLIILAIWGCASLIVSFVTFSRKDILN